MPGHADENVCLFREYFVSSDDRFNCGVDLCEVEFNLAQAQGGLIFHQRVYCGFQPCTCGRSVFDQSLPSGLHLFEIMQGFAF
ncbi:hypothetical protein QPJ95_07660 [Parasedimentitalea psychrophila]|uniref:Uncharacterized protein n=1 Tax=Parasedimentitalea psychrophila TaxID=2997337 RepID=A0A9Y2L3M1_9RHOB|nr:hypothetical protein [Parasedimentitalea psychrophila]WIY26782.1 hypothetical protein QPJ95_07660 [Parasedimentitalea psychrophila]